MVNCGYDKIDFENTEKDESPRIIIFLLVFIVIIVVICICCCKKMARMRFRRYIPQQIYTNVTGINQNGQIYPPQVNSYVYPQEMRMVYNNPNIQYNNVANMNMPNTSNSINPEPAPTVVNNLITSSNMSYQSYSMVPQSSTEPKYNGKDLYEKP